jgi:manganese transport protein
MDEVDVRQGDAGILQAAADVLTGQSKANWLRRIMPFMGPAFIASVAYMDPGNFATNIQGGAKYGYMLLWVILTSNLMAMLLQTLSAKLGIASGQNLAELCRTHFSTPVVWFLWVLMELVAMATDLAEFLGAALGFSLLFGFPLWLSGVLAALVTFLLIGFERHGFRPLEWVITGLVGVVAICYLVETILDRPDFGAVFGGAVTPRFQGTESVLLAAGILGATVMPHAIFLHSALTQNRIQVKNDQQMRRLFGFQILDVGVAMGVAGLVNMAMLVMAAATFHVSGRHDVGSIEEAYKTLQPLLGNAASYVFGLSLLAAGLSSTVVGTMAGQVMMQGFVHRKIPLWVRRLVTLGPSFAVILMGLNPTRTLVISQVVLSFGLPFAIIPLVYFTRRKDVMGVLVNHSITTVLATIIGALVIALNLFLLYQIFFGG